VEVVIGSLEAHQHQCVLFLFVRFKCLRRFVDIITTVLHLTSVMIILFVSVCVCTAVIDRVFRNIVYVLHRLHAKATFVLPTDH